MIQKTLVNNYKYNENLKKIEVSFQTELPSGRHIWYAYCNVGCGLA